MNSIQALHSLGQSLWYDNIQRCLLEDGTLASMIRAGEIRGVTSNPTIFHNAIAHSQDYDPALKALAGTKLTAEQVFYELAVQDIRSAADLFQGLYEETQSGDGYVSLEVSPYLAHDTQGTIAEARRLWELVQRPNLKVKIPATPAGIPAIAEAIASGININVTLIFSLQRYAEVMDAYLQGLEARLAAGLPLRSIDSVASFFVSRIDTKVDAQLQVIMDRGGSAAGQAAGLIGKAAIANARLAYLLFKETFAQERFQRLAQAGARFQRPLWASTGTKNPSYRDVVYVEELIGPITVNTVPPQTLAAFRDHGQVRLSVEENLDGARQVMRSLAELGIRLDQVTAQLEDEGVQAFSNAFTALLATLDERITGFRSEGK
jgi:transaldolase